MSAEVDVVGELRALRQEQAEQGERIARGETALASVAAVVERSVDQLVRAMVAVARLEEAHRIGLAARRWRVTAAIAGVSCAAGVVATLASTGVI